MSSNSLSTASGKAGTGKLGQGTGNTLLIDKLNIRRSTPDSEALASSDEESDVHRSDPYPPTFAQQKPTRRASWLNDTSPAIGQPRKGSFASSSMSPTTSHPTTPSGDPASWVGSLPQSSGSISRAHPPASLAWGSGIWTNDSRKEPPSRLTEVLPSPTTMQSPGGNNSLGGPDISNSPVSALLREQSTNSTIPFAIPLQPTPKTYRSQSYSVGQLDPDTATPGSGGSPFGNRGRQAPLSSMQHRPSRPSMLSEMSSDGGLLGKLNEIVDDDDEPTNGHTHTQSNNPQQPTEAQTIEMLARENAMLRQQQFQNARLRPRSSTTVSANAYGVTGQYNMQGAVPEDSDYAIDELDEANDLHETHQNKALGRRLSEFGLGSGSKLNSYMALENRKLENVKKAYWQSSLGFGGLGDIPQSRRHSFADMPTRHGSISSVGEPAGGRESMQDGSSKDQARLLDGAAMALNDHAASYFGGTPNPRTIEGQQFSIPSPYHAYNMNPQFAATVPRATSPPHRTMYGMPQARHNQQLYIVLFKCSRADIFFIQEGTGLSVKPGDLVIVEADRGTDLGTVAHDNVDWQQAKELKEHYAEEHYKWLMMYSQGAAGSADGSGAGLMAASNSGSTIGGMGPPTQHSVQEPSSAELKPKMIKRLAQTHEVQALRDKEGNEAKAKRVCMQKVKEHGLHMEILDAEFQMDWKKLTFYYFADAYINFNSLVTDLFKVYKTRIWMSAINPASFASPSLGLQAPSGIGPGAVGVNRNAQSERRHQQPRETVNYNSSGPSSSGYQAGFSGPFGTSERSAFSQSNFVYGYPPYAGAPRTSGASASGYMPGMLQQMDGYSGFSQTGEYQSGSARFPSPHRSAIAPESADYGRPNSGHGSGTENWVNGFQGLSLNSR